MLFGLFALFVVLPVVADKDLFWSHTGYSMLWLMLLYLAGAYFRLHVQPAKPGRLAGMLSLGVYVAISVFLALQKQFIEKQLLAENSPNPFYFKNFSYTSVWIVLSSLALFFFFMRINVRKKALCGIISFFSKTSFGVYIIHTQPLVWNALLAGTFAFFAAYSAPGYRALMHCRGTWHLRSLHACRNGSRFSCPHYPNRMADKTHSFLKA